MSSLLSPLDSRYYREIADIVVFFSDESYTKQRILVELRHFANMMKIMGYDKIVTISPFREITSEDIERVAYYETITNHDVKAIEYFLREYLSEHITLLEQQHHDKTLPPNFDHVIHIGLTSQDVNSIAFSANLKAAANYIVTHLIDVLMVDIGKLGIICSDITIVARTHGQPAIPMKMSHFFDFYSSRIGAQTARINMSIATLTAKFGGAVGTHAALKTAFPDINWDEYSDNFVAKFGLIRTKYTTQIDSYDSYCNLLNDFKQFAIILKDFAQNVWNYIRDGVFMQIPVATETGSSTMPQKVNPIDLENALGQIELFVGAIEATTRSLAYSQYQRDIKDSTILRSFGEHFGKLVIAIKKTRRGIAKIAPNREMIAAEVAEHPETLMETVQTLLRAAGIGDSYERIKAFSRGRRITREDVIDFVHSLKDQITDEMRDRIISMEFTYD